MEFAKEVCVELDQQGVWCDYIDPCSGLPVRHALAKPRFISAAQPLLPFPASMWHAGACCGQVIS